MTAYIGYDIGYSDVNGISIAVCVMQSGCMACSSVQMPVEGIDVYEKCVKNRPTGMREDEFKEVNRKLRNITDALFRDCCVVQDAFQNPLTKRFVVAVGCPVTWSPEDMSLYKSIFMGAGCFLNPCAFFERDDITVELSVETESDAVLMNLINAIGVSANADEQSYYTTVDDISPERCAVVFDFGSLTTDVIIFGKSAGNIEIEVGVKGDGDLGARYIDKGIYNAVLKRLSNDERQKYDSVLKESGDANIEKRAIYLCRLAKEKFFNASQSKRRNGDFFVLDPIAEFPLSDKFCEDACGIMDEALSTPIAELGGKSWKNACRGVFEQVKQYLDVHRLSPRLVFLTGGASRMNFVGELARETFSGTSVLLDSHPTHCMSRGLVCLLDKREKDSAFTSAVEDYINDKLPKKIEEQAGAVASGIATKMVTRICEILQSHALRWKHGDWDALNSMEDAIYRDVQDYSISTEAELISGGAIAAVLCDRLVPSIKSDLEVVCRNNYVPFGGFDISDPLGDWAEAFRRIANNPATEEVLSRISADKASADIRSVVTAASVAVVEMLPPITFLVTTGMVTSISAWAAVMMFGILVANPLGISIVLAVLGGGIPYIIAHDRWGGAKAQFIRNIKGYKLPQWVRDRISDYDLRQNVEAQKNRVESEISDKLANASLFKESLRKALLKPIVECSLMMTNDLVLKIRSS